MVVFRHQLQPQTLLQSSEHYLRIREEISSGKCKCGRQWDLQLVASCIPKASATTDHLSDNTSVHSHGCSSEYRMHKFVAVLSTVDNNVALVQCLLLSVAHIIAISRFARHADDGQQDGCRGWFFVVGSQLTYPLTSFVQETGSLQRCLARAAISLVLNLLCSQKACCIAIPSKEYQRSLTLL